MAEIIIQAVNISEEKGVAKRPVSEIVINNKGVEGDAHAGNWHRQVSLLGTESLQRAKEINGREFQYGDFGENITSTGMDLHKTAVFDRFEGNNVVLEVTQIGKKCHSGCAIFKDVGDCIMPREGIFTKVINGGVLKEGDKMAYVPRIVSVKVITLSDRASAGVYKDTSGDLAETMLEAFFKENNRHYSIERILIPDSKEKLEQALIAAKKVKTDILITTGGTGIGPRDITPDVVGPMLDKEIPGIMEMIRVKYGMEKPNTLVSRSIAGVMGTTLVYCVPGSNKGVKEYLDEILPTVEHSLKMVHGSDSH